MYKDVNEFQNKIIKLKNFRELPEQYKNIKFCKLYYKMYEYMLNIPKDKIIIKNIVKRNNYVQYLFEYIQKFIEAKDFYNWKDRIYNLVTEKLGPSLKKYKLLYNSKAKEFFDKTQKQYKISMLKNYGVEYPLQSKEIQDKMKSTNLERYGEEYALQSKEVQNKSINTWKKNYGFKITNPFQAKEIIEKISNIRKNKSEEEKKCTKEKYKTTNLKNYGVEYPLQSKEIQDKMKSTNLERYGEEYYFGKYFSNHSKFGDEVCILLDNAFGNPEDTYYAIKNKEFFLLHSDGSKRKYDFTWLSKKLIVEADGDYNHGLLKNQKYAWNTPVEEIWHYDKEKEELAIQNGYKVFHILYSEYKKDPINTINKLIKQIREVL